MLSMRRNYASNSDNRSGGDMNTTSEFKNNRMKRRHIVPIPSEQTKNTLIHRRNVMRWFANNISTKNRVSFLLLLWVQDTSYVTDPRSTLGCSVAHTITRIWRRANTNSEHRY